MRSKRQRITFKKSIAIPSLLFILLITACASLFPNVSEAILSKIQYFLFHSLDWVYVWAVTLFVLFLFFLVFSKYGSIKLGRNDSKPEYSFFSWVSMLFAAGMGIGLMYFGVAEPMSHFADEAFSTLPEMQRAKNAQVKTFFHWGIHAWSIYGVVGLSLAYFSYRYKLPLSLRSCFYPMLKDKINGVSGDIIDTFALCSTFFGITTSLGFGVVQLSAGLTELGVIPESTFTFQVIIVAVVMTVSITSATSGVNKGVKYLSQLNIVAAIVLLLFILFAGPTVYLLGGFTEGLGDYISSFFAMTFNTHSFSPETKQWYFDWTILYWAWWISWSPYVGIFIARISKGRTIREFVTAVLIIPALFNFLWMSVYGNAAIYVDLFEAAGGLSELKAHADVLLFKFLDYLPFTTITQIMALFILCVFFVTSADSGIFVMNNIATNNAKHSPKWQLIFWGVLLALLSLVLLNAGGLEALQTMTLITALPFAVLMVMFCINLLKGLIIDISYYEAELSPATRYWSGAKWKQRLNKILAYRNSSAVRNFMLTTVNYAFKDLRDELQQQGVSAEVRRLGKPLRIELVIRHNTLENFVYGVKRQPLEISDMLMDEENFPEIDSSTSYIPETYFGDSRVGYNVEYFTKRELITDVLKQYERFLSLSGEERNQLFIDYSLKGNE